MTMKQFKATFYKRQKKAENRKQEKLKKMREDKNRSLSGTGRFKGYKKKISPRKIQSKKYFKVYLEPKTPERKLRSPSKEDIKKSKRKTKIKNFIDEVNSNSPSPYNYVDKSYYSTPKKKHRNKIEANKIHLFSANLAYSSPRKPNKNPHAGNLIGVPYGKFKRNRDFQNRISKEITEGYVSRCGKDFIMTGKDKIETLRTEVNNLIGNKKRRPQEAYAYKVNKFTGEVSPNQTLVRLGSKEEDGDMIAALARDNVVPIKIGKKLKYVSPSKDLIFARKGRKVRKSRNRSISKYSSNRSRSVKSKSATSRSDNGSKLDERLQKKVRDKIREDTNKEYARIKGILSRSRGRSKSKSFSPRKRGHPLPEEILGEGEGRPLPVYFLSDNLHEPVTTTVNYLEVDNPNYRYSDLAKNVNLDTTEYERRLRDDMYKKKKRKMKGGNRSKSPSRYQGISTYQWEEKLIDDTTQHLRNQDYEQEMRIMDEKERRNEIKKRKFAMGNERARMEYELEPKITNFAHQQSPGDILDKVESLIHN